MSRAKEGDRIGAVLKSDRDTIHVIGYGTYEGMHVPDEEVGGFNLGIPNPKLVLDDGSVVWGCECWWGSEDQIKDSIAGRTVINVDMKAHRESKS